MASELIILPVDKIQSEVNRNLKKINNDYILYVSLNKPHESLIKLLEDNNIKSEKIFFIDCVSTQDSNDEILKIHPTKTNDLKISIKHFLKKITGKKYLIIDSLSTLLIYNNENKVAQLIKEITEYGTEKNTNIIAYSPKTEEEELLNKIFNFFDEVKQKK